MGGYTGYRDLQDKVLLIYNLSTNIHTMQHLYKKSKVSDHFHLSALFLKKYLLMKQTRTLKIKY
jgi:hypothetical protein